ncbi:MAG: DegT/DnrJ/EryC1/StrS family aminotransferase [Oceanospirillaceae bacterium]|nr:DegT/DnrJ/EryC1/StrS family aminotransferase [Oceanospirillaceae bacterium]
MANPKIWLSAPHMGGKEKEYMNDAIDTNWVAPLGPNVNGFEEDLQNYNHIAHAAALSSGTAALHLAMRILDIKRGDYVLVQSFTFCGSANPITYDGATPVFIDSEGERWNMSPKALKLALEDLKSKGELEKVKAIMPVHLYGVPADMEPIMEIADSYGIPVIEDAAESLGSTYDGQFTGTFGELGAYSFNGNKIITTSGGGALVSDNADHIAKARHLSTQARQPAAHYEHTEIGFNYRMSNIVAGIGRGQMEVLDERIKQRRAVFNKYVTYFQKWNDAGMDIQFQGEGERSFANRWLTAILIDPKTNKGLTREDVRLKLEEDNIESRPLWKPMHMQPVFEGHTFYGEGVCERLFEIGLCLPSCSSMTDEEWNRISSKLDEIFENL